jgi:putative phosphoesterase
VREIVRRTIMRTVGVISDTHGLVRPEVLEVLEGVERIVHAGDIGSPEVIETLERIAPIHAVRGNVDRSVWAYEFSETEVVEVGDVQLFVLHDLSQLDLDPATAGFRVVIYGHSHDPKVAEHNGVLFLNPGSAGPRRLRLPISVARMHIGEPNGQTGRRPRHRVAESYDFGSGDARIGIEFISLGELG